MTQREGRFVVDGIKDLDWINDFEWMDEDDPLGERPPAPSPPQRAPNGRPRPRTDRQVNFRISPAQYEVLVREAGLAGVAPSRLAMMLVRTGLRQRAADRSARRRVWAARPTPEG
jgi:hypothetical protein